MKIKRKKTKWEKPVNINFRPIFFLIFAGLLLLLFQPQWAIKRDKVSDNSRGIHTTQSSALLNQVILDFQAYQIKESPYLRLRRGLTIENLPEISEKKEEENQQKIRAFLTRLKNIKKKELTHQEVLSYELLKLDFENSIQAHQYLNLYMLIQPYNSPIQGINQLFRIYRFTKPDSMENYLHLLKQYPRLIDQILAHMKKQLKLNILIPEAQLKAVMPLFTHIIQTKQPEKSLFFVKKERLNQKKYQQEKAQQEASQKVPDNTAEKIAKKALEKAKQKAQQEAIKTFQQELLQVITTQINPAFKKLVTFLQEEYAPKTPQRVGMWQYPQGKDYYGLLVKYHTTLDITPEEVHQTGVQEVKRLMGQLEEIRKKVQFKGDQKAFLDYIKNDPRFKPKTPEQIGKRLMHFLGKVKPQVPHFFKTQPQAPCGVKRLDPAYESTMTYGYYQDPLPHDPKGYYLYNASKLEERNIVDSASLILHELIPGHHFQINLQRENKSLPNFRKDKFHTAYIEGWAEYAAQLGKEMGIYQDPYDYCGLVLQDLMMAVRLVVDTGMNYYGWTREKASQYMRDHLNISDTEIKTETLRYSTAMPGQALAYKIGHLKFMELRKKAEKALGERFDLRTFHETVLGSGSLPLTILEAHIDWYIKKQQQESITK